MEADYGTWHYPEDPGLQTAQGLRPSPPVNHHFRQDLLLLHQFVFDFVVNCIPFFGTMVAGKTIGYFYSIF